jgi:hypothetical protein
MLWPDKKGAVHLTYGLWDPAKSGKTSEWAAAARNAPPT